MKNNSISGSVSLTHRVLCGVIFLCALTVFTAMAASDERGIEYKQFRPEMVSCDAAILYKTNTAGLDIAISVIAYGKSPESGNWRVTDISLSIDSVRIGPDAGGKFYALEDRLYEYPAGVVLEAIDRQIETLGLGDDDAAEKSDSSPEPDLLSDTAKADISGENRLFALDWNTIDRIREGRDFIEVTLKDPKINSEHIIKIDLMKGPVKEARFDYSKLRQDELMQIVDTLKDQIAKIEKNRLRYKEDVDPEYLEMQSKIEDLEVERSAAYKAWRRRQTGLLH